MRNSLNQLEQTPLSIGAYIGYTLLFFIPCIGFIFLIIFSASAKNINLKNFAISHLIIIAVATVVSLFVSTVMGVSIIGILNNIK